MPIRLRHGTDDHLLYERRPGTRQIDVPHLFIIDKQGMIRNDFAYYEKEKSVFEGPGLFPEIDKLLK